ncbi:hypothetical protein GV828_12860 [Flavobacterium sp. NST-5]|uniref:Knr4/Smi1-like domain-containing protein n=1 Tax=Flavobacterium ichthyis TaxID=2698827 RepID=A0ABW9ZBX3_9FLAO|nr:SUKH-3 domain-containing protein [Flavobacterium ichthyis]NBL66089.1 hypothetical protein [Flavobacterium ichthyis]
MKTIKFIEKVQNQFRKAGWNENRNIKEKYENSNILKFKEFPQFLKEFLYEYGDLTVSDAKSYQSEVVNKLKIGVEYAGYEDLEDYDDDISIIGKMLFPFAFYDPDCYMIACDEDGKVYMLGDYTFRISDNFIEGIEILVTDDISKDYYQLDEDTGEWVKNRRWND